MGQNKYYFPSSERAFLLAGLEARRGYFMSVRPTFRTLMVNINTVHGAFYTDDISGNLAQVMQSIRRQVGFLPNEFFAKMKVFTRYRGYVKKHTIMRLARDPPGKLKFYDNQKKKQVTVKEYFTERTLILDALACERSDRLLQSTSETKGRLDSCAARTMPICRPSTSAHRARRTTFLPSSARS